MRRTGCRFGILSNKTVRFAGFNQGYSDRNKVTITKGDDTIEFKHGKLHYCVKCRERCGCSGVFYDKNQYSKRFYKMSKNKNKITINE